MNRWLAPRRHVRSVVDVDPDGLVKSGIRAVIFDLDNTLLAYSDQDLEATVLAWFDRFRAAGLRGALVSNAFPRRTRRIAGQTGLLIVAGAPKPNPLRLRRALTRLDARPAQTALIGDQLFTDMLPGNLLGLYTILVEPLKPKEFISTRVMRVLERLAGRTRGGSFPGPDDR
jgi:HAD superfamily phosphatase (TIGR01668 family)